MLCVFLFAMPSQGHSLGALPETVQIVWGKILFSHSWEPAGVRRWVWVERGGDFLPGEELSPEKWAHPRY